MQCKAGSGDVVWCASPDSVWVNDHKLSFDWSPYAACTVARWAGWDDVQACAVTASCCLAPSSVYSECICKRSFADGGSIREELWAVHSNALVWFYAQAHLQLCCEVCGRSVSWCVLSDWFGGERDV
jgi:hypothetical protein